MAEPDPVNLDARPKPAPRKPPAKGGTVTPIKKATASGNRPAAKKPSDVGVVVEKVPAVKEAAPVKKAAPKLAKPKETVQRDAEHPYYTRKSYTAAKDCQLYEATGGSGQIAVRSSKVPVVCAISKTDPENPRQADRDGTIFDMYATTEAAEKVAVKMRAAGYGADIVSARPYAGQQEVEK